jgi:hypothetical protein
MEYTMREIEKHEEKKRAQKIQSFLKQIDEEQKPV